MANDGDSNARIALNYVDNYGQFSNVDRKYAGALGALGATGSFSQNYTPQRVNGQLVLPSF